MANGLDKPWSISVPGSKSGLLASASGSSSSSPGSGVTGEEQYAEYVGLKSKRKGKNCTHDY